MNTKFNLKTILPIIGTLILLQSCNIVGNVVHVENDKVTNTRRV